MERKVLLHFVYFLHIRHAWFGVRAVLTTSNLYFSRRKVNFLRGDKRPENKNNGGHTGISLTDTDVGVFISARRVKRETSHDMSRRVYQISAHAGTRGSDVGRSHRSASLRPPVRGIAATAEGLGWRVNLHAGDQT